MKNFPALDAFPFFDSVGVVTVGAEIEIDGEVWRFTTGLVKKVGGEIVEKGEFLGNSDDFGLNVFPDLDVVIDGNEAFTSIPRIEGTVDLDLDEFRGRGVDFSYNMRAEVIISNSFCVGP